MWRVDEKRYVLLSRHMNLQHQETGVASFSPDWRLMRTRECNPLGTLPRTRFYLFFSLTLTTAEAGKQKPSKGLPLRTRLLRSVCMIPPGASRTVCCRQNCVGIISQYPGLRLDQKEQASTGSVLRYAPRSKGPWQTRPTGSTCITSQL